MNVDLFCKRYAIALVLVLTQNYAIANVNEVKREQAALAKIVTSYFKVPWINLNSSWTDEVSSACRNDVETLFESADAGEMWALRMLDSASKVPSGFLTGNIRDLGMYDQCIRVKEHENHASIQGRHCMVSLSMPSIFVGDASAMLLIQKVSIYNPTADVDLSLTTSVCLPSSCGVKDVTGLVNASIESTPQLAAFEVTVTRVTCSKVEITDDLILGRILAMAFFATVASLLFICTVCDFVVRARSGDTSSVVTTAAKFSLYTNAIKLSSTKTTPDTMPGIHGIRFLNTCLVVMGHRTLSTLFKPHVNLSDVYELRQSVLADFVHMLPYVVDTFFVMSGFLTATLFLRALRAGIKFNMPVLYVHRYLRLTPCLAVMLLFTVFFLPDLGSGPMWETVIGVSTGFCRKNWWTNLLYVQNFVNAEEMCLLQTWYLAVEMQLFWICPIILYPLFHRPKLGLTILGLLSIASFIAPAVQLAINQWPLLFNVEKHPKVAYHEFFSSYPITYNRVLPYLIGIFMGYDVVNNKRVLTKNRLVWNWILTGVLILFSGGVTNFIQPNAPVFNVVWEVIYVSIGRLAWSIAMAWVLYACTQGYGGLITRFLSLPMFVPLSRMCYSIYLVHLVIQVGTNATVRTAEYGTPFGVLYLIWGDLAVSIAIAFFLTLCFESPVITLEKILRTKRSSSPAIAKHASTRKKRKLSAIIKECSDLTRSQVSSDLAVERIMTVSEVLSSSSVEGSMKTPAEWAKVWQDWKFYLSRNENQRETCVEDFQTKPRQLQIGVPTLEKEFFIFLAGVSCGLGEIPSFTDLENTEQKSEPDSCSWENAIGWRSTVNLIPFPKERRKISVSESAGIVNTENVNEDISIRL